MYIKGESTTDPRRYNAPCSNEIAAIFTNPSGNPPFDRSIAVYPKEESMQEISIISSCCDPMIYPILFPSGEDGWSNDIKYTDNGNTLKRCNVTMMEFYQHKFAIWGICHNGIRSIYFNPVLTAGKLTQQYMVDTYTKIEGGRLTWIRNHQRELRAEAYGGLSDFVKNRAKQEGVRAGKLIILPSSFTGGP
ncbi:hypothetical protein SELMODRAFT_121979 [Selaginella moellendorffii]|uniref:Helitron helicase-like domain-containing protein n=1 Tax=Selaginella moellendorffii TaxID=88036 RepID=D8SPQ5_SELML|nr:hypothetical protein SELMODRAFT_121979 [Selaginella moellendorffii]